jgi:hypothetical protein
VSIVLGCFLLSPAARAEAAGDCRADAAVSGMPARPARAPGGHQFLPSLQGLSDEQREAAIYAQLMSGNVPGFLRRLAPVHLRGRGPDGGAIEATVCVTPDYLAVGTDDDYFLVPMRLETALAVADHYGFALPTPRLVDAIYQQSGVRLRPQPLPAGDTMRSTAYYWRHSTLVQVQRALTGAPLGLLTAGDKKDLVITNRLWTQLERVAIYGWHLGSGRPIQPLSTVHGWRYADYSHGVRLVSDVAYVDGQPRSLLDLLGNAQTAGLFSDEGAMPRLDQLFRRLRARFLPDGGTRAASRILAAAES